MKKNIIKISSAVLLGSLLLSGCSAGIFGLPGLFYETTQSISELDMEGLEALEHELGESDIWDWPDTEDTETYHEWDEEYVYEVPEGAEEGSVTVLVYMNGSTLETEAGCATKDIKEMLKAGYSEDVNIVIQTMGTKYWAKSLGIASDRSQTYVLGKDGLELVRDDLGQLDCTLEETLREFIEYGTTNYPAERNILLLWNHGCGPAYGFGLDEFQNYYDSLSIGEIVGAIKLNKMHFDFIGMDCCIMSSLEVAYALRDCCDYAVLSEDFESELGWYYTNWIKALYDNPAISTYELSEIIIDDMIRENEEDPLKGNRSILALIDESKTDELWEAWTEFAYENEEALLETNYSQVLLGTGKAKRIPKKSRANAILNYLLDDDEDYNDYLNEYCVTDLMGLAQIIDSDSSKKMIDAIKDTLLYVNATSDDQNLTGMYVTLPYSDFIMYGDLKRMLTYCGFDSEYIEWLHAFCSVTPDERFNWGDWGENFWGDWGDFEIPDYMGEWDF